MDIVIKLISYAFGLSMVYWIIRFIIEVVQDYKDRHHKQKMRLCRKCKHNKERVVKMYNYNVNTTEKYCNLKECIYDTKEVLKNEK